MPFILIFQLIFSGGFIPIPKWIEPVSSFTVSTYGMRAIAAQAGYNDLSMDSVWNTVNGLRDSEINATVTIGELMDLMDSDLVSKYWDEAVIPAISVDQASVFLNMDLEGRGGTLQITKEPVTLGQVLDLIRSDPNLEEHKDQSFTLNTTVGELIDLLGEEKVKEFVRTKTAASSYNPYYDHTIENITKNWLSLLVHMVIYAAVATFLLEFIDKDRR